MRKSLALLLIVTLSVGCTTTTKARVAGAPPPAGSKDARQIYGLVLADGTEVAFEGPAELQPDGSVQGKVLGDYDGPIEGARTYRAARYEASEIVAYRFGGDRKANVVGTLGVTLLVVAGLLGLLIALDCADESTGFDC